MKKSGLKMPRVRQIGIVVKDIEKTIDYYERVLGIGPWARFEGEPTWCYMGEEEVSLKGRMAMAQSGRVQLELIQILEGTTIYDDMPSEEGIHHLGFFVRDFDERMKAARAAGIEVLTHALLEQAGLRIEYAYLDTTEQGGVITEYIQSTFLGLPFPMTWGWLTRLGAWMGDKLNR